MSKIDTFSLYFDQYYPMLFRYAVKCLKDHDTAEEVVQETFIKLWEKLSEVQHQAAIKSYLFTILKNKIIDLHRKINTRSKHSKTYAQSNTLETAIENDWELQQQIEKVYALLKPPTDEIFALSRQQGLTYDEIAKKKSISIKTVELHISKALSAFRNGLKDYI